MTKLEDKKIEKSITVKHINGYTERIEGPQEDIKTIMQKLVDLNNEQNLKRNASFPP